MVLKNRDWYEPLVLNSQSSLFVGVVDHPSSITTKFLRSKSSSVIAFTPSGTQQFADGVTMYHPTRNTLDALASKARRVGRGLCQLQRYHPDRYGTPGVPPRPTGIKRPSRRLPLQDRLAFSALSTALTAVRGVGYYAEYLTGTTHVDGGIPRVDDRSE